MNKKFLIYLVVLVVVVLAGAYWYFSSNQVLAPSDGEKDKTKIGLTKEEARAIAEKSDCLKEGPLTEEEFYNENSQTWWFGLRAEKTGCNPACVVFEENKAAEINWRCTGLVLPEVSASELIRDIFRAKYDRYAGTLSVTINQEAENHIRGEVIFESGMPGGIFLATKIDNDWQVVHEGNGEIPCSLSKYGFPSEMLTDCAK
ncbi:MAG TPA: hypothetical protein PKZ16_02380 [bacterium]|nr:hypothetical protein [bacterium]HPL95830.1 hypothetical protein [bacterium]